MSTPKDYKEPSRCSTQTHNPSFVTKQGTWSLFRTSPNPKEREEETVGFSRGGFQESGGGGGRGSGEGGDTSLVVVYSGTFVVGPLTHLEVKEGDPLSENLKFSHCVDSSCGNGYV